MEVLDTFLQARHRKQEEGPPGRRWSFHNGIRKTKKREHKFSRGSEFLHYGCQGPKAKMKNRIRCGAMIVPKESGTHHHKDLLGRVRKKSKATDIRSKANKDCRQTTDRRTFGRGEFTIVSWNDSTDPAGTSRRFG